MNDLVATLLRLTDMGHVAAASALLVFVRVGAAMALLPGFGETTVPLRVRLVLTLAFTALVAPLVPLDRGSFAQNSFWPMLPIEVFMGLLIGLSLRAFVFALQIAGAIIAQATSLSQLFAMPAGEAQPVASSLLVVSGVALLMLSGLPVIAVEFILLSYEIPDLSRSDTVADGAALGLAFTADAIRLGFTLAMPFVIMSGLYNIMIGVLNRAMAQLMVTLIGAPALAMGTLVLMMLALPDALQIWRDKALTFSFPNAVVP